MLVLNIHERELPVSVDRIGALIDSLGSKQDRLWPQQDWPKMKLDRPLGVGAAGGHGPIRYFIEDYVPGNSIRFRFTAPAGFDGCHSFQIITAPDQNPKLRHSLKMTTRGSGTLNWFLIFRPLHDALLEDCLAVAEVSLGLSPHIKRWPVWVRLLRWLLSGGKSRPRRSSAEYSK